MERFLCKQASRIVVNDVTFFVLPPPPILPPLSEPRFSNQISPIRCNQLNDIPKVSCWKILSMIKERKTINSAENSNENFIEIILIEV